MRPLLLLLLLGVSVATPAWADITVYARYGGWDVFRGTGADGRQVCGTGSTNPTDGRALSLRLVAGDSDVTFIAARPGWQIPAGTQMSVVVQVGLDRPWVEQATGNGDRVTWTMDRANVQAFDQQFRRASSMTVSFPDGSEKPWIIELNGSTAASNAMGRCVTAMGGQAAPAVTAAPTQATTQPFGTAPAAEPSAGAPTPLAPPAIPAAPAPSTAMPVTPAPGTPSR